MSKVFISYSREDAGLVYPLVARLKRHGVSIWIDEHNIKSGMRWDVAIEEALRDASHMLVILSKASVESQYVRAEIDLALDTNTIIVPILISPCTRPFQIRQIQYINFMIDESKGFDKLLKNLPHDLNIRNESNSSYSKTMPITANFAGVYGPEFAVFPEDKKTIQEGGKYIYPTLAFESTDQNDRRSWIMKFNIVFIGREYHCDILIPSEEISRRHLKIIRAGMRYERYQIVDLGSTNGTWLNDEKLPANKPIVLKHGDKINLANILHIVFQFTPNLYNEEKTTQIAPNS